MKQLFFKKNLLFIPLFVFAVILLFSQTVGSFWNNESENTINKNSEIDTEGKISLINKIFSQQDEVDSKKPDETSINNDDFEYWAVLENLVENYKLIYPADYQIKYKDQKLEMFPSTNKGKIVVSISDSSYQITTLTDNCSEEEKKEIKAAADLIEESFQFINESSSSQERNINRFEE